MDKAEMLRLHRQMVVIRLLEEKCEELYQKGKIGGFMHIYIGQEATGVGIVSARQPQDNIITAYRDHGIAIACGMESKIALAEMLGKMTGCCKGKGGSMHLADKNLRFWGGHAIVGAQIPLATGLAWAEKYRRTDSVTACFFGDGSTNIGYFHEALNLAAVWKLPVVFVCENNKYGMWTPYERVAPFSHLRPRAEAYGIPYAAVDGMDLLAARAAAEKAFAHVRSGAGPYFLEAHTYRYRGHSMGDQRKYRAPEEIKQYQEKDPLGRFEKVMLDAGIPQTDIDAVEHSAAEEMTVALHFAEESPFPPLSELWTDIYAEA